MNQRVSDWEQRLSDYLLSKRQEQFQYGKHDCAHFVAGAVEAITGENPMADIDRDYDTKIGSVRVIKSLGHTSLEQVLDNMFYPCSIGFAQTGDLAFHDGSVGIVIGAKAVFATEIGYTMIDRSEWTKSWGVGRGQSS